MKRQHSSFLKFTARFAAVGCLLLGSLPASAQDSLGRLFQQSTIAKKNTTSPANQQPDTNTTSMGTDGVLPAAGLIPDSIETPEPVQKASYNAQVTNNPGVSSRKQFGSAFAIAQPVPLGVGVRYGVAKQKTDAKTSTPGYNKWDPNAGRDEYVFDGNDRDEKVSVDRNWNVYGLQTEDTIGHFDTLDGRRLVTPSNRVAIYAPRFGAVRKLDGVF